MYGDFYAKQILWIVVLNDYLKIAIWMIKVTWHIWFYLYLASGRRLQQWSSLSYVYTIYKMKYRQGVSFGDWRFYPKIASI